MRQVDLDRFRQWFSRYCKSFYTADVEDQKNISLKEVHTFHVCDNMAEITGALSLGATMTLMAQTVALFHDVGRFPQYRQYKTFLDSVSVNHGLLGARVLTEENVLGELSGRERELITQAVKFHNAYSVPNISDQDAVFLIKLIRDADKLDIWRVFVDYYEAPAKDKASAVSLGFPDTAGYSEEVLSCLFEKKIASLSRVSTLNDFKLLQLSWIYDLNFAPTCRLLSERQYLTRILSTLPETAGIADASILLREELVKRIQ